MDPAALTLTQRLGRIGVCAAVGAIVGGMVYTSSVGAADAPSLAGCWVLAVFVATIASFLLRPYGMGPMVILALIVLSVAGALPFKPAMAGFGNSTVWLVVAAFMIAQAVGSTGLGRRISLTLVARLGRSTLGLGYALAASELTLGPVVPSNTARGGGIVAPIVQELSRALGSRPEQDPRRAGTYLVLVAAHANLIAAAMFLTGMAANPLVAEAADSVLGVELTWTRWAVGALVPGLIGMALLPLLIYRLAPPELKDAAAARTLAREKLAELGAPNRSEKIMAGVFVLLIVLWSTSGLGGHGHGMHSGLVAWIGVGVLLLTGAMSWGEVVRNEKAWDTLIWLGGLLAMAGALKQEGVVTWAAGRMGEVVGGFGPLALVIVLGLIYFYSMYAFSMLTAHIAALVAAFFAIAKGAGADPMLTAGLLAYFSNLCACTTNYSTGPVVIHFGLGYVPVAAWFRIGFVVSLFHLAVWLGIGLPWWKLLGWW